jgi:RNA polymerase sigma-70 factor (ECF subfamily)
LHEALHESLAGALADAFPFLGPRCARITEAVLQRIDAGTAPGGAGPAGG